MSGNSHNGGMICGRAYEVKHSAVKGAMARIIVDGITHPSGTPIRFKSLDRAERHIRNMRLERPE